MFEAELLSLGLFCTVTVKALFLSVMAGDRLFTINLFGSTC